MGNSKSKAPNHFPQRLSANDLAVMAQGEENSFDYRVYANKMGEGEGVVSMWHDVPLFPFKDGRVTRVVNMINEIPRCNCDK